jgi:hypothetical protein
MTKVPAENSLNGLKDYYAWGLQGVKLQRSPLADYASH